MKQKTFPKGYKQYKVLRMIEKQGSASYTEIIKLAFELSNGLGSFDKVANRGYWSGAFVVKTPGFYGSNVDGWITRLCTKGTDGRYRIKQGGEFPNTWKTLCNKFAGMSIPMAAAYEPAKTTARKVIRVMCDNGMVLHDTGIKLEDTEVTMRGLKLGDKVTYYSKNGNKSGIGYVFSKTEYADGTGISTMLKVRDSLTNIFGFSMELHYDAKNDKFVDGIKDCEIIKI